MSGAPTTNNPPTTKATTDDSSKTPNESQQPTQRKGPPLDEDDEFEDFPVDDWPDEQTEGVNGGDGSAQHLWEESWDDDDTNEDFAVMLKEELKRVGGGK